jgi:outer membrane protein assembly factor BamD (BamD/ComL family)
MIRMAFLMLITVSLFSGCKTLDMTEPVSAPAADKTAEAQLFIQQERYPEALAALEKLLQDDVDSAQTPKIKYLIASIYVAPDNPQHDYALALFKFEEFLRDYPNDNRAPEAESWKQTIKLLLEAKKENERLRKNIEGLKQLDVTQEQKRRGK